MNELLKYVSIIKRILDNDYGKERVFYNGGDWYDRYNSRNISLEELEEEVLSLLIVRGEQDDYVRELTEKIYELMGEEEAEKFLNSIRE